jgi:hypothetical protein
MESLAQRQLSMEQVPLFRRSGGIGQRDTKRQRMDRAALKKKLGVAASDSEEEAAVPAPGTAGDGKGGHSDDSESFSDSDSDSGNDSDSGDDGFGGPAPRKGAKAPSGAGVARPPPRSAPVPLAHALEHEIQKKEAALQARQARPAPLAPEQLAAAKAGGATVATSWPVVEGPARVAFGDEDSEDSDTHAAPLKPVPKAAPAAPQAPGVGLRTSKSPYVSDGGCVCVCFVCVYVYVYV